jgi:hypothetical protein
MMSEDSDYTSDVNFPVQHQHNTSAHQYGGRQSSPTDDMTVGDQDCLVNGRHHIKDGHQRRTSRRKGSGSGLMDTAEMNGGRNRLASVGYC